jgi:hypothetical protein
LARNTLSVVKGKPFTLGSYFDPDRSRKTNVCAGTAILLTALGLETRQAEHPWLHIRIPAIGPWIGCDSVTDTV